jgi:hypothetical protein
MMDPVSIMLGFAVASSLSMAIATIFWPRREVAPQGPPGNVELEVNLFAHPEQALAQLKRDLDMLDDNSRLELKVSLRVPQGWTKVRTTHKNLRLGPFYGSPDDVFAGICAALLDDDSPLVKGFWSNRQTDETHPLVRAWGRRSNIQLSWLDSDSPVYLTVTGEIRHVLPDLPQATADKLGVTADELALVVAARQEVDGLGQNHQARIRHAVKERG